MRKYLFTALLALSATAAATVLSGCGKKHEPSEADPGFSRYISGYTSGQISTREAIRIELADDPPQADIGAEITERLFTLTPPAKGKAHRTGGRVIEFRPDAPLKEGTPYKVAFSLDKILPNVEKDFRTFTFDVYTVEQDFAISESFYQPVNENQNRWNTMSVAFSAADALTDSEAQSVFRASLDGKALTARLVNSSGDGRAFLFVVDSIERTPADRKLKLVCDGKAVGSAKLVEKEAVIHALNAETFKVAGVQNCAPPERCVRIVFTDPLGGQDLKGLIELDNFTDYTLKAERNAATIFPEAHFPEIISGRVDKNIKNFAGKRMAEDYTFKLTRPPDKPVVRLLNNGTILPDSKNLLVAFSAINLRAVEMRVIKIYEHNILAFLQENPIGGSYELRRSGRMAAKKLLRLDSDRTKNLREWNNYAVDVSALVNKEPGAVYRVELIIRQEFSVYPCGGQAEDDSRGALNENNFVLTEDDMAVWDSPRGYYSAANYDYEKYEWRERNNPCHPTFYMDDDNIAARGNLFASNVGIVAKKSEGAELFVAVQDIRTTEPLGGASVRALNYQLAPIATGTADANGFCVLRARRGEAFIIEASHGRQKGYLKVNDGGELSLSRFDIGGNAVRRGLKGFIYGERGVWRPGDEIFMTFILEDRQKTIPAGHPVTAEIYNPQGQFYRKLTQTNPVGNFYRFAFKTEEQSPTGFWRAVISVGGAMFERTLRVEAIKPNRLKINADFGTELIEAQSLRIALHAQWLHGAAAKGLKAKMLLKLNPAATAFKGYEAYRFTNPAAEAYSYEEEILSGQLDDEGRGEFTAALPAAQAAAGMLRAAFTTTVEESGGGESITINSLPYSPFPAYAGLNVHKTKEYEILATDTTHYFDVALLDASGKPLPSGELVYKAYRLKWSWWWDEERPGGLAEVVSGSGVKPVIEQKVGVKNGRARIAFRASSSDWGSYLIYIKDPKGGHATGERIFVDDPSWGGRSRQGDPQGLAMLTFAADKQTYTVGEEVNITLAKGGKGRALVSLENGTRTMRQWWVETKDGEPTPVKFNVAKELAPNFYVHITLLQHHDQTLNDMPIRMYGVLPVTVSDPLGELKPVIEMPALLRSEQEFTVSVREAGKQGMAYTLAVVDEGLLDISNFKTPDPYAEFNVKEALGVKTYDLYGDVVGAFAGKLRPLFSVGGGEDLNRGAERKQRFKPVVMFLGPFELKAGASNKHKVKLPPYNGSVRVMVVAANAEQAYGRAEKAVPVRNPLMAMATLPRVLGPGEEVLMPVNIFVADKSVRNVTVKANGNALVELRDGASQNLTFKDAGDDMVFFKLKTGKQTGPAQITVTASSGGEVSTETINVEIRNPNPPLTVFNSYVVRPGETLDVDYKFDEELPDRKVVMEYARIPSVNLSGSLQYLIGYPHGCAEQITSGAFPQLFLHSFTELSGERKREVQANVNAALAKLYAMQTADGGISMWSGSSQPHDWVTSYAGHFAAAAKERGYNVPQSFVNNWKKYQKGRASNWNSGRYEDDMLQAYRLYSLAAMGAPDLASMNKLRERPGLSQVSRWLLASAYALCGRKDAARQAVAGGNTRVGAYSPFRSGSFGSSERDEAIILETCVLLDDMEQALAAARRVSEYLSGGSYSTQAAAWALMAMARFADKSGKGGMSFTASHNGKADRVETGAPVYVEDLAQVKKSGSVRVTNGGGGNLYIGRTMSGTPFEDRAPAAANNLRIRAEYADIKGAPFSARGMDAASLPRGTDFVVTVSVTNTSLSSQYTNLALTHIIPSGWEIFNTRLSDDAGDEDTASGKFGGLTYQDIRDDRVLSYFSLPPGQTRAVRLRLQAAYPGRFFMPAVACQAMYDNTVYARTTGAWVEVVK